MVHAFFLNMEHFIGDIDSYYISSSIKRYLGMENSLLHTDDVNDKHMSKAIKQYTYATFHTL